MFTIPRQTVRHFATSLSRPRLICIRATLRGAGCEATSGPPAVRAMSTTPAAGSGGTSEQHSQWRGPVSWATFAVLLGSMTTAVVYYNIQRAKKKAEAVTRVETYGKPAIGGPWSLVDETGLPVTSGDMAGYHLLYFGFTFCPDICPNELVKISKAVDLLAKKDPKHPVTPVFVTLDPRRDSCAQVGVYVRDFHPKMRGLTGTPGQVAALAKRFRVYFQEVDREEENDDYLVDHSIVAYLMSPEGEFLDFYTQLLTAGEVAERMAATIAKEEKLRLAKK